MTDLDNQSHVHIKDLTKQTGRRMGISLVITLVFVFIEVAAGIFSNSLALLTDAAHNITDVLALGLSLWAIWLATRPASHQRTYGYHRAGILAALVNSTTLVLIALGIFYEAYQRFIHPPEVQADVLIVVGIIAVLINLVTALLVRQGAEHDLNVRAAFLHLMGDVLSTIGAVVAGVIIRFTDWNWLDPLVSVMIGLLIVGSAWSILKEAVDILMENTPTDIDMSDLIQDINSVEGVRGVHDLHVWSITRSMRTLSAHLVTDNVTIGEGAFIQARVNEVLYNKYNVSHATLQLECEDCETNMLHCTFGEVLKPH